MEFMVTVCIMTYYAEKYIAKTIDSVLNQKTSFPFEILVSDDCSGDKTIEIVQELQKKHPDIIHININKENLGISLNIYNCFCMSKGKYICILDGDDLFVDEYKLQKQYDFLEKEIDNYIGVATLLRIKNEDNECLFPDINYRNKPFYLDDFLNGHNFPSNGLMFRNTFSDNSIKDYYHTMVKCSKYIDDLSFCILLLMKGKIFILDCIGVDYNARHQQDEHNFNSINDSDSSFKKHIELLNNFHRIYPKINLFYRYYMIVFDYSPNKAITNKSIYKSIPFLIRMRITYRIKLRNIAYRLKRIKRKIIRCK